MKILGPLAAQLNGGADVSVVYNAASNKIIVTATPLENHLVYLFHLLLM